MKQLILATTVCIFYIFSSTLIALQNDSEYLFSKEELSSREGVIHDDFFINSIPKAGTHLIKRCMLLMLNKKSNEGYNWTTKKKFSEKYKKNFLSTLSDVKNKHIIHKTVAPYFPQIENFFSETHHKCLFQVRDPRDAIISLLFYLETRKKEGNKRDFMHINSAVYNKLSFNEKITALLTGSCCTNYLQKWYREMRGWMNSPYVMVVRFEDLIGSEGGGSKEKQLETIWQIANYLNVDISEREILSVAEYTFLPRPNLHKFEQSFSRGQVESWKDFFTKEHKVIFKKVFGNELIEMGYEKNFNW